MKKNFSFWKPITLEQVKKDLLDDINYLEDEALLNSLYKTNQYIKHTNIPKAEAKAISDIIKSASDSYFSSLRSN